MRSRQLFGIKVVILPWDTRRYNRRKRQRQNSKFKEEVKDS